MPRAWIRHGEKATLAVLPTQHPNLVMGRVHQKIERYFEDLGHLERIRMHRQRRMHEADHRRHAITGARQIVG